MMLIWHLNKFQNSWPKMDVIVVGEDNVEAYVRGIIEDSLDWVVVHHRVNTHIRSDDELITKEEEEEYGEEEVETKNVDTSVEYVKEEDETKDVDTSVEYVEEEDETKDVDTSVEVLDEGIDLEFVEPLSPIKNKTFSIVKKEFLLGILKKPDPPLAPRGSTSDYWAEESPSKGKVFSLSGFIPRGRYYTRGVVEEEKNKVIEGIIALGGTILGGDTWSDDITHIVTFCLDDMEQMTEKVMCALAAGSTWIVTSKYVRKSRRAGEWLSPQKYAWNERATQRKEEYSVLGPIKGQLFWDMKAVFLMKDEEKEEFYGKLVSAGGGKVASQYGSIDDLLRHSSSAWLPRMVTHVFLDDVKEWTSSSKFRLLVKKTEGTTIKYWFYKSLMDVISGRDAYLPYWNIEDYFPIRVPYVERSLKRTMWDRVDPSGIPCKVRKSEDVRRKRNPERPVVVFNPGWIDNLD